MHIPDGFISPKLYLPGYAVAAAGWAFGLARVRRRLSEETIPTLAVLSALSFVLMSVSLPLPGGTTAHATGVCLLALLAGVWEAYLALSLVLLLQAVLFGQGGVTPLPLNALAMGLAGAVAGRWTFLALRRANETVALFVAAWLSVCLPAALVALALGVQPLIAHAADGTPLFFPFGPRITLPALLVPHAILGIGEGILTVLVFRLASRLLPGAGQFGRREEGKR
jgi:cobalt/nickel transport system permease protein